MLTESRRQLFRGHVNMFMFSFFPYLSADKHIGKNRLVQKAHFNNNEVPKMHLLVTRMHIATVKVVITVRQRTGMSFLKTDG